MPTRILPALAVLAAGAALAAPTPVTPPTIGSANTATADPSIPRPATTPCRVRLFTDVAFADYSSKFFTYTPPAGCGTAWEKVVLEADFSIEAGRQFDRTADIWIGGVNVYFGTTAEPSRNVARAWHVERDLTDYSALLRFASAGRTDLYNIVSGPYTSTLWGTAELVFYPARGAAPAVPDVVLPISDSPTGGVHALNSPGDELAATFSLPRNIEKAALDVVLQHQGANDEFWYTCVPTDRSGQLQSCAGTAFREGVLTIDGKPGGVVPIFPWIFTGGIDPLLWRPIPAVQALNFVPYRIDLTPFAGVLSDGNPHRIALHVTNDSNWFATTATLLLSLDTGSAQVTGALTRDDLDAPDATIDTSGLPPPTESSVSGPVITKAARSFAASGWVQTSHGRVFSDVTQQVGFVNRQDFQIDADDFVQNIHQLTTISTVSSSRGGGQPREVSTVMAWPLEVDISEHSPFDTFTTSIDQRYDRSDVVKRGAETLFSSLISNSGSWHDTYPTAVGQSGAQRYFSRDSTGACYSRSLTAAGGVLTAISDGAGCGK